MHKTWITADWHFDHRGMNKSTSHWDKSIPPRDFASIEQMNEALLENINSLVMPTDTLWNLGDVFFGSKEHFSELRAYIKCKDIRLILGNHDKQIKEYRISDAGKRKPNGSMSAQFSDVRSRHSIKWGGVKIYLLHEPMHTWPAINRGAIQLHGHCHANLPDRGLRQKDVGVDTNNYKPYLLSDVVDEMLARPFENCPDIPQDHHA